MRLGYLFRGFLGDIKLGADGQEVSTPDGNATYSWSIEDECYRRGHRLIPLGENLDAPAAASLGQNIFSAFSPKKRLRSYERMLQRGWSQLSHKTLPELDAVLIEWRWPIPGRNTVADRGTQGYQPDLDRQLQVMRHYADLGVPIVVWDLDHKLTAQDELLWAGAIDVIETAVSPRILTKVRHRVEPPFVMRDLLQHDIDERMPSHHLGYIGSRYERDETIDEWIKPITPPGTHRARFWGKWESDADVRERWPGVTFSGRIGVSGFRAAYCRVAGVPLLAKKSYYESGFITPRPWEALLFGAIPIGLKGHHGVEAYAAKVASDPADLLQHATWLRGLSPIRRRVVREESAHMLSHMDVRHFMDVIEGLVIGEVAGDSPAAPAEEPAEREQGTDNVEE